MNRDRTRFRLSPKAKWEDWFVRTVALLTGLMGIVNLISATRPAILSRLRIVEQLFPLIVRRGSHFASVLSGFALILLSFQLLRRKRVAWLITIVVLLISTLTHLIKNLNYEEAILSAIICLILVMARNLFYALSDFPSIYQGIRTLVVALIFVVVYATSGFYFLTYHFHNTPSLLNALEQALGMALLFSTPNIQATTSYGEYFINSVYGLSLITYMVGFYQLARPVLLRKPANVEEKQKAQEIVQAYGKTSLARLCLLGDKAYFFSTGGTLIAYVQKGRCAIVLGDPIGPAADCSQAVLEFKQFCARNDWVAAYYQTTSEYLSVYEEQGYDALCIGQEAIVDLAKFTLEGSENKTLRNTVNKLQKLNFSTQMLEPPISKELINELRSISNEWLTMMHGSEKRFSVGWFDEEYLRSERIMICLSPEKQIISFANVLTSYQKNELSIDLMRRRREVMNGTMEFLFVALFEWARVHRYETFSLGLSAFAGVGESPDSPIPEKILHLIYDHINQFYNFKGLHEFKAKFHPRWEPRYLIYPGVNTIIDVIGALIRADSGDDFWRGYLHIKK